MKHLCDRVTFEEAVKLRKAGCTVETDYYYKVDATDSSKHTLTRMIIKTDWNNWNGGSKRAFSAPTYAEVLDWLMDTGYDYFAYTLRDYLDHFLPSVKTTED